MHIISGLLAQDAPALSPLAAGILAAAYTGLCQDSRSFASRFGVAHALVLRECVTLAEEQHLIELDNRQDPSQRLFFGLSDQGRETLAAADRP